MCGRAFYDIRNLTDAVNTVNLDWRNAFQGFFEVVGCENIEIGEEIYKMEVQTVNAIAPIMTETGWRSLEAE
jgi:hypothetical protein